MKVYYDGKYRVINELGEEIIYKRVDDIPNYRKEVTEVEVLPGTLEIKNSAFYNCTSLTSVKIPKSVERIEHLAFSHTDSLLSINLPDSITEIESCVFDCSGLEKIKLPKNITKINASTFWGCGNLKEVKMPDSITEIDDMAFSYCNSLKKINLSKNLKSINKAAFSHCRNLSQIILPNTLISIGVNAFYECKSLEEIEMPDSVISLGTEIFRECTSLEKIKLSKNLTEIGQKTFYGCTSLKEINIPNDITKIGIWAFRECMSLKKVTIPDNVIKIDYGAFSHCKSLKEIKLSKKIEEIEKYAFEKCESLESIEIPKKINKINANVFEQCESLKKVSFLGDITKIGDSAFYGCFKLSEINLPNDIKSIGDFAFGYCINLKEVNYHNTNIQKIFNIRLDGTSVMDIANEMIENKIPINYFNIVQTSRKMHLNERLDLKNYHKYGFNMCNLEYINSEEMSEKLKNEFINSNKFHHRYPKLVSEFATFCNAYNISVENFVKTFDVKYTKEIIDKKIPLYPALLLKTKYSTDVCMNIIKNEQLEFIAFLVNKYDVTKDERYKGFNDFFMDHLNLNINSTLVALEHFNELTINKNTTLKDLNEQFFTLQHKDERENIENKYGIKLSDCKCNIDPIKIKYDDKIARVLDFDKEEDLNLAIELGYHTCCCQHFNGAGESAMMHGYLNDNAGFWVLEDKKGSILAQAMIWIDDNNSLIFDSIEFANTDLEGTAVRIEQLRSIVAKWAKETDFKNIIMGVGRNYGLLQKMENAYKPKFNIPEEEDKLLHKDNFYFKMYTDTNDCVYLKKDKIISNYLMEDYDITKEGEFNNMFLTEKEKEILKYESSNLPFRQILENVLFKDENLFNKINDNLNAKDNYNLEEDLEL